MQNIGNVADTLSPFTEFDMRKNKQSVIIQDILKTAGVSISTDLRCGHPARCNSNAERPGLPALVWVDHPFLRRPFLGELAKHLPKVDQLIREDEMALRFSINLPEIQMF